MSKGDDARNAFLAAAASKIGYREGWDPNGRYWNNDTEFGKWYGMNRVAWCAIFVSWCANVAGILGILVPKFASCFAGLTWFRKYERTGNWPPAAGDVFILREYNPSSPFKDPDGWATIHTGVVERYLGGGRFQTIEGNTSTGGSPQGNGVYRLIRQDSADSRKFVFCRPDWEKLAAVVALPPKPTPVPAPTPIVIPTPMRPPVPKPSYASVPGYGYAGSRWMNILDIRPGSKNDSALRFNGLLWDWLCKNSELYARAHASAWMAEPAGVYGPEAEKATQELYRVLSLRDPKQYSKVTLPTWPGIAGVRAIGGQPF